MPFTLIKGTFIPAVGIPDGDTVRFRADNSSLLCGLERKVDSLDINGQNCTVALRYEGIDAPERGAREPFACDATARNINLLGLNDVYDTGPGYILARQLGRWGRPIAFVFAGKTEEADGTSVHLGADRMRESVNFQLIEAGVVYPLFYDTLFADLRTPLAEATVAAREADLGLWPSDRTGEGVTFSTAGSLPLISPIFPKIWRRLKKYTERDDFTEGENALDGFVDFLKRQSDRLLILSESRFTDLDNIVEADGNEVRMDFNPEDLVFKP